MSREPNEQLFRSFLIAFRKFVSKKEDVYANRVNHLLMEEVRSDELRGRLIAERQKWLDACKVGAFQLVENGRVLEPEQVMELWINGSIFHNDRRMEEALDRLNPLHRLISKHACECRSKRGSRAVGLPVLGHSPLFQRLLSHSRGCSAEHAHRRRL